MCGIAGFNFKNDAKLSQMTEKISHRGPDDQGFYSDEGVSLGHKRLSIIDVDTRSRQPMESSDGRHVIVFNGEVYNYRELRDQFSDYQYETESDTEVLLAAYQSMGRQILDVLEGIFAFAIWDKQRKELFLARDRSGVKPLYYYWEGEKFIFSSEIKSIIEHDVDRVLDFSSFYKYLYLRYSPEPDTLFENIKKLPHGSFAVFKKNKLSIQSYIDRNLNDEISTQPFEELKKEVKTKIDLAVKKQLISDKPLGLYLSGGIDSSIMLDAVVRQRGGSVETFSCGFQLQENESPERFNADFMLARKTSNYYHTSHNEFLFDSSKVPEYFEKAVWHLDEPISNSTIIPMLFLAEQTKKKVDVILTGEGGDELFGGYKRYRLSRIMSLYQNLVPGLVRKGTAKFHPKLNKLNTAAGTDRLLLFMGNNQIDVESVLANKDQDTLFAVRSFYDKWFGNSTPSKNFERQFMFVNEHDWLVDESLAKADKMAMAHGLEARVPFLDSEVISLAHSIPLKYKVTPFETKKILREAFSKNLPEFLVNQPKRGWVSPGAKWLRHPVVREWAKEILSPAYYPPLAGLFDWSDIRGKFEDHLDGRDYHLYILWTVLTFLVWAKEYKVVIK